MNNTNNVSTYIVTSFIVTHVSNTPWEAVGFKYRINEKTKNIMKASEPIIVETAKSDSLLNVA